MNSVYSEDDFIRNIHKSIPDLIIYGLKLTKMQLVCYQMLMDFQHYSPILNKVLLQVNILSRKIQQPNKQTKPNKDMKIDTTCLFNFIFFSFLFSSLLSSSFCFILTPLFERAFILLLQFQRENMLTFLGNHKNSEKRASQKSKAHYSSLQLELAGTCPKSCM